MITTDALPTVWRTWWLGDFAGRAGRRAARARLVPAAAARLAAGRALEAASLLVARSSG